MGNLAHNSSTGVRELCIRKSHCRPKEGLKEAMRELGIKEKNRDKQGEGRSKGDISVAQTSARANAQRSLEQRKLEWAKTEKEKEMLGTGG